MQQLCEKKITLSVLLGALFLLSACDGGSSSTGSVSGNRVRAQVQASSSASENQSPATSQPQSSGVVVAATVTQNQLEQNTIPVITVQSSTQSGSRELASQNRLSIESVTIPNVSPAGQSQRPVAVSGRTKPADNTRGKILFSTKPSALYPQTFFQAFAKALQPVNDLLLLPRDIQVSFEACGIENAAYIQGQSTILMCYELFKLFETFYNRPEDAKLSYAFVFYHELSHALIDAFKLPVLGSEETAADALATVLMNRLKVSKAPVLAGTFFIGQKNLKWTDSHRVGPNRFGDLACWATGGDQRLLTDPLVANLIFELFAAGRDCVAEYKAQEQAVMRLLGNIFKSS